VSDAILRALRGILGERGTEWDGSGLPRAAPDSTDAVAHVVGLAYEQGWRIRIEGARSWMPADVPAHLALSTRALSRVVSILPSDLVATAQAGVSIAVLTQELRDKGAWLGLDPPGRPERSMGSVVTTGTAGAFRHRFGPVRDHVLGCAVVLGDGQVVHSGGLVVKNVAGYDLTKLQIGGFGAFGVVTEVQLRLRAEPAVETTLVARAPRDRLTRAARELMEADLEVGALELLSPALAQGGEWALALHFAGTAAGVAAELDRAQTTAGLTWSALLAAEQAEFWDRAARGTLGGPVTLRLGVLPDGLDPVLDLLAERLDLVLVSGGGGSGGIRWSGSTTPAAIREVRRLAAEREIPVTLERAPWPIRRAVGHFGAYREGVGHLVAGLRGTLDPRSLFQVPLEGSGEE